MSLPLPDGFRTQPATQAEVKAALQRGQAASADFVMMVRETEEDGTVDDQTLLIFCPAGGDERRVWEKMAAAGHALRCSSPSQTKQSGGKA